MTIASVILTKEQVEEIEEAVRSGLSVYEYSDGGREYSCLYCGEYARLERIGFRSQYHDIKHEPDCLGERVLKFIALAKDQHAYS